ncbi:MAG: hypothetical protein U0233_10635 [Nitrospira sp.]
MGDAEVALPLGVAGVAGRQLRADREAVAIGLRGLVELALGAGDIAEPVVGDAEVALPVGVAGVAGRQLRGS